MVDESLRADFTVSAGGLPAGFLSPRIAQDINDVPEVDVATPLRLGQFRSDYGRSFFVAGINPAGIEKVAELDVTSAPCASWEKASFFSTAKRLRRRASRWGTASRWSSQPPGNTSWPSPDCSTTSR